MSGYIRHIQDPKSRPIVRKDGSIQNYTKAFCGADVSMSWAYIDLEHAELSAQRDYIQPCKKCLKAAYKEKASHSHK